MVKKVAATEQPSAAEPAPDAVAAPAKAARSDNQPPADWGEEYAWPPRPPMWTYLTSREVEAHTGGGRTREQGMQEAAQYYMANVGRDKFETREALLSWLTRAISHTLHRIYERDPEEAVRRLGEDHGYFAASGGVKVPWRDVARAQVPSMGEPVWHGREWARYPHKEEIRDHYVAKSEKDPGLITYFQDAKKGQRLTRTPIKPGRYLSKYFKGVLTEKEIAFYAAWQATGSRPNPYSDPAQYPLGMATTPDEIERVYRQGPASCMDGNHSWDEGMHPCRIYGAGDLAVAHLYSAENPDSIVARALVWPERKVLGRVYPTVDRDSDSEQADMFRALESRMLEDGYTSIYTNHTLFDGARLLKVPAPSDYGRHAFLMPYVDVVCTVKDCGDHFIMARNGGDVGAQNTSGRCNASRLTQPGEALVEMFECPRCNCEAEVAEQAEVVVMVDSDGDVERTRMWCAHCAENHAFHCEGLDAIVSNRVYSSFVETVDEEGDTVSRQFCDAWLSNHAVYSDYSQRWHMDETESVQVWRMVDERHPYEISQTWTVDEADAFADMCQVSGRLWLLEDLKECPITGKRFAPPGSYRDQPDLCRYCTPDQVSAYLRNLAIAAE